MSAREWGSERAIFASQDEQPCIIARNETAISYDERLGNASKTLHIETLMTFDDLRVLCKTLMGVFE